MKKNILAENMLRFGTKNLTNSQIFQLNENEGPLPKEIIDNHMRPHFDFNQNKMYVELDDIDSVLVYDFDYSGGELRLTFDRTAPETKLNYGVDKYIDYIDSEVTRNPDKYDFSQKMSQYNQD